MPSSSVASHNSLDALEGPLAYRRVGLRASGAGSRRAAGGLGWEEDRLSWEVGEGTAVRGWPAAGWGWGCVGSGLMQGALAAPGLAASSSLARWLAAGTMAAGSALFALGMRPTVLAAVENGQTSALGECGLAIAGWAGTVLGCRLGHCSGPDATPQLVGIALVVAMAGLHPLLLARAFLRAESACLIEASAAPGRSRGQDAAELVVAGLGIVTPLALAMVAMAMNAAWGGEEAAATLLLATAMIGGSMVNACCSARWRRRCRELSGMAGELA